MRLTRSGLAVVLLVLTLAACQDDAGPSAASTSTVSPSRTGTTTTTSPATDSASSGELVFQMTGSIWVQAPGEAARKVAAAVQTDNQHPDWSPDGSQIAFEANFAKIWTVGHDGTGEQERFACEDPCAAVYEPAWSPDGSTLAFIQILGDGTHTLSAQLMRLDVASGKVSVVHEDTAGDVWDYTPRWSGDGTRLVVEHDVFASNRLDEEQTLSTELRVIDLATSTATELKGTVGGESPDWSPTDELIVFSDGVNLFTIDADGRHKRRLTKFKVKRESAIQPSFTPDGASVVFTWVQGVKSSGQESTLPAMLNLSDGSVVAIEEARGATHTRLRP